MSGYQALRSYSPFHDCDVVRISVGNEHGHELFMLIVDDGPRRSYRAKRNAALDALADALDAGGEPGEVKIDSDVWDNMVAEAARELERAS